MFSNRRARNFAIHSECRVPGCRPYETRAVRGMLPGTPVSRAITRRRFATLEAHLAQVVVALGDAVERLLRVIVFNDVVLDPGFAGLGENLFPVDEAAADFGEVDGVAVVLRAAGGDVGHRLEI